MVDRVFLLNLSVHGNSATNLPSRLLGELIARETVPLSDVEGLVASSIVACSVRDERGQIMSLEAESQLLKSGKIKTLWQKTAQQRVDFANLSGDEKATMRYIARCQQSQLWDDGMS